MQSQSRVVVQSRVAQPCISRSFFPGAFSLFTLLAFSAVSPSLLPAQSAPQIVGRVEGRDFVIEDSSSAAPIPQDLTAGSSAVLASGRHLAVRSGQARILLNGGGEIVICGPARLQLLESQGSLTVALDYGTLHINVASAEHITIFTPLVVATPVSVGGDAREATIGLALTGEMCIRAASGAVRVEQQLSGQSLFVPQFGQLSLAGGQLAAAAPSAPGCACEIDAAQLSPASPASTHETIGAIGPAAPRTPVAEPKKPAIAPPFPPPNPGRTSNGASLDPPSLDVPIYRVYMPPLIFDASSPVPPPDPDPSTIILVRSVRVREDTVIRGTIAGAGAGKGKNDSQTLTAKADPGAQQPQPGFFARVGGFFRRVFGGKS